MREVIGRRRRGNDVSRWSRLDVNAWEWFGTARDQ